MAEVLGAAAALMRFAMYFQSALRYQYRVDPAYIFLSQMQDFVALSEALGEMVSGVQQARGFTPAEREAVDAVVKDSFTLLQIAQENIDRLARGKKRGSTLISRLQRDSSATKLSEDLTALSNKLKLVNSLLVSYVQDIGYCSYMV